MANEITQDRFAAFNLDPALAEMVEAAPPDQLLEAILRLDDPASLPPGFQVVSKFNRICTGRFRATDAWKIRRHPNVISLKAARPLGLNEDDDNSTGWLWSSDDTHPKPPQFTGRGCIVAALDFGLDFAHPNFLNSDGTTRVMAFWHQGADYDSAHPNRFGYGREYLRDEINAALRTPDPYRTLGNHPGSSDSGLGTHGTHTLDIAAGNGRARGSRPSAAPNADIVFVHLSTPSLDVAGDLGDSVRLLEGLDYVDKVASGRPWVVNLSVGRTAGSHDGTSLVEQGMHELLRLGPSRAIVQSAGNYRSANLAVEGWLRDGEQRDLDWNIDPADTTANEMDAWYSGKDRFVVAIRAPGGRVFTEVKLGEVADIDHRGSTVGRIYHRKDDPNNHDNHVEVFLHKGAPHGTWTVRLIGDYVISGRFHAWIERDLARRGAQSRFDAKIASTRYTLGTIATSPLPITVGAYDAAAAGKTPAHFSSSGPTRDERTDKPELLAPGVKVVAARSIPRNAKRQQGMLIARSGTSMAAPHVTGVVAAMFEAAGRPVSIDVIRECLKRGAVPLASGKDSNDCAWGRLDAAKAIRIIRQLSLPDKGANMNPDAKEQLLDGAERALEGTRGDRRQSESGFLSGLLRALDSSVSAAGLSPAALYRAVVQHGPLMNYAREVLDVLALPSQRPEAALRPGDWMLRAVPGTGDVGHVAVLASDDLLTESMLDTEDISAEGTQPGYYGLVIEAGAFPHNRARPFARRLLDRRGRVAPHTVILRPRYPQADAPAGFPPDEPEQEVAEHAVDIESVEWEAAVFRAIFGGERRINALLKIGRDAGSPNDQTVRNSVLGFLRVPFPQAAQRGGIKCEREVRDLAPKNPDTPRIIFTGRYESSRESSGQQYFWAINQAGDTVIAIRTRRNFTSSDKGKSSREYRELRGDIQADGTAVLFQADDPTKFWGYLQQQPDRSMRWHDGSYLGADGKRVVVDGVPGRDERLQLSADNRPTLMESLYKSDDNYLSVLLQQREWYPLTKTRYEFLRDGASSDALRDLLTDYLKTPKGIKHQEKLDKLTASGRVVNYIEHLLWDGVVATKPIIMDAKGSPPALRAHGERARRLFPHGHHNNAVLATHVAKIWLAHEKLNHAGEKRSFLDWLTKLAQERQEQSLSRLLDVPLNRSAGTHRYHLTLDVATAGFFVGYAEGYLRVEKLTAPKWPGKGSLTFDVQFVTLGKPKFPSREEVFDLVVTTPEEWNPDDFEGTLFLGEMTAHVGIKSAKAGATVMGGYLRSKNGLLIALEDGDVFLKPGSSGGKQGKPKVKVRAEGMVGRVRRHNARLIDLSTRFSASRKVTGNLLAATHFCSGSSLLTPPARQLLRVVCADQLAALDSPTTRIMIIGHTDRTDTDVRNQELSVLRARNVKTALVDILGAALKVEPDTIPALGFGEWLAIFKLRPDSIRNPADRRVDLLINGSLVATFRE